MAETQEKKPFWMDDEEWQRRKLPALEGNMAGAVTGGVPQLNWVTKGGLVGAWVVKDGLLLYQLYKKDRKEIFDAAQKQMDAARELKDLAQIQAAQQRIAEDANFAMEQRPWWPNFKSVVEDVFKEHFRFHPFKIDFYREVDSYSVVMAELDTPVKWSAAQYEAPISKIALQVGS